MKTTLSIHNLSSFLGRFARMALLCETLFFCLTLRAQDFVFDSYSIDGAGGQSSGGDFELAGSVSQPDASDLAGGDFELNGGFWGVAADIAPPPGLTVSIDGTDVLVSWPQPGSAGFVLESTADLAGGRGGPTWTRVDTSPQSANGILTVRLAPGPGNQFYRLHKF